MPLPDPPMAHVSYADLRQNLSRYMDEAIDNGALIVVTRQGGKGNVVMISEAEFAGWQETVRRIPTLMTRVWTGCSSARPRTNCWPC